MAVNDIAVQEFVNAIKEPPQDTNNTYNAIVSRIDDEGVVWVYLQGSEIETPTASTSSEVEAGDSVTVQWRNNKLYIGGNYSNPSAGTTTVMPSVNFVSELLDKDISADSVSAATGYIGELTAEHITADDIQAGTGYIKELRADNITAEDISASSGYIKELRADNIEAEDIVADHADIGDLKANKADIDLLNVDVAWIEHGNIKKAEVFDENVFDLSGNRATLSRIDASKINVANLRADNLVVRRINGQPVVGGYTLIDSNSPQYETKNPQALGWYEFVNAEWVLSTDTTVDMTKAYYQEGNEVSLYDQAYIDALEDDLQQQIDGAVETYTGTVVPTLVNKPYTDWYDTSVTPIHDERAKHIGDIYYVVNSAASENGYCYRFTYDNTSHAYSWVLIKDSDVTKALSDISELKTFESETTSWIEETDEGLETIRTNHTALSGVVDKTVKESVQLWFTKANTTAPAKPTAEVTSTSTAGNAWRKVVPAWNASYPNYYYCWQYKFVDGTFGWSDVVRDIAMGETQGTARDAKNTADAALPASTFTSFESTTFKNVKDTVDEQTTKFTNMTTRLGLNSDGTGANTDIVAKESALEQTVDGISTRVSKTETKLAGMYATSSTAAGTAAKVATITPALPSGATWELGTGTIITVKFTNANTAASPTLNVNSKGAKAIKTYANGNLTEAEYKWKAGSTFTFTYNGTNWLMHDSSASVRMNSAETGITQNAEQIALRAKSSDVYTKGQVYTKTEADSAITQKANEISLSVAQTEISKIEVGGRNLLTGTSESKELTTAANQNWFMPQPYKLSTYADTAIADTSNTQISISFDYSITGVDTAFNMTASLRTSPASGTYGAGVKVAEIPVGDSSGHAVGTRNITSDMRNNAPGAGIMISGSGNANANAVVTISNVKLEFGNKATDWSPAPEDLEAYTDSQVFAAKAEIKVTTDGISTEVEKKTDKSTIISTIRQSAETVKIKASQVEIDGTATFNAIKSSVESTAQSAVDGIEVGGRNLLIGTSESTELTTAANQSWFNPQPYKLSAYANTAIADTNNTNISISFDYSITGVDTAFNMVASLKSTSSSWNAAVKVAEIPVGSSSGHAFGSRDIIDGMRQYAPNNGILISGSGNGNANAKVTISNVKVEFGNKATDWTPAPEDVQAEIDAKKSVHTINATGTDASQPYATIMAWASEGRQLTWSVDSTDGIKVGDTVRIKVLVSDMGTKSSRPPVYVVTTCRETPTSSTSLKTTSHGLDTTIIDGGNILTNSITANQIAANAVKADELDTDSINNSGLLSTGALTVGAKSEVLNSNISVGGRNLLLNTGSANGYFASTVPSGTNLTYDATNGGYYQRASSTNEGIVCSSSVATESLVGTEYYTHTLWVKSSAARSFSIQLRKNNNGADGGGYTNNTNIALAANTWTKITHTFKGASGTFEVYARLYIAAGTSCNVYVKDWKLEKGNKATDWTPAPSDLAATATNYITRIDDNGIRIHPASTENNSVVINAKGMEVFKGGTEKEYSVAKYGDSARIGKESGSHLTLSPDSMSMSDGTKDVFNLLQKTMYIYWNRNYKGRQFANSTDRYVDSWETNTTISTWDSITVNYKLNNTSRTKKITSISNGVLANDEIYVRFNYSGTIITLTYGRGSSAASSDIIKLGSAVVYYVTDEKLSQLHTGTYPNTTVSGALRIGNGTSDSNRRNLMLVDWSGTGKFKGDILAFCGADSSGGMSLTKAEENIDAFKYEDANGYVYINAYRVGRIVSLLCSVRNTASIAPGANLYLLNLTNAHLPKPLGTNTSGTGIYSSNMIIGNIYYNNTVTPNRYEFVCRNGGSTAVSTGGVGFTITYICQMDEVSGEIKYMDD